MNSEYREFFPDPDDPASSNSSSHDKKEVQQQENREKHNPTDSTGSQYTNASFYTNPAAIAEHEQYDHLAFQETSYREHPSVTHPGIQPVYQQPLPQIQHNGRIAASNTPIPFHGQPPFPMYQQQPYTPPLPYHQYPAPIYGYDAYGNRVQLPPYNPYYPHYQRPGRNGYQLTIAILATIGSSLSLLVGLFLGLITIILAIAGPSNPRYAANPGALFNGLVIFTAMSIIALVGGCFGLYHSIQALRLKRSRDFSLPSFWFFLLGYLLLLVAGFALGTSSGASDNNALTVALIALAAFFPSFLFYALAIRRIHFTREIHWPTTWRRFTLALVSGGTLALFLALILELLLSAAASSALHISASSFVNNSDIQIPHDPNAIIFMILVISVIAPLVEEGVKPLAVVIYIGRVRNAAEAFVLGFASGIGFNLVETMGYISQGTSGSWVVNALERSTTGLLHGFGAAMVALGWYYLTHPKSLPGRSVRTGLLCICYAICQHAIWNGSAFLQLLPEPIGSFLAHGTTQIGSYTIPGQIFVYIILSIVIITVLLLVTGTLRGQQAVQKPDLELQYR